MEPLFESEITVDAGLLEEWQRRELATSYRPVYVLYFALLALCLALIAASVTLAARLGMAMGWVLAGVFAALFGVLAWSVATLPRRLVRNAIKKDKENTLPYRSAVLVGQDGVTVLRNRPEATAANEAVAKVCLETAAGMQARLQQLMAGAEALGPEDVEELGRLRGQLVAMKEQMEALAAAMPRPEGEASYPLAQLSGYLRTPRLHGLYFGDAIVLVGREGFVRGDDAGFTAFVCGALQRAAAGAENGDAKRAAEKALRRYWKDEIKDGAKTGVKAGRAPAEAPGAGRRAETKPTEHDAGGEKNARL